ncbi:MAG: DUF6159 family protein [Acidobacteriota bacterium]
MFQKLSNSWQLIQASARVLRADKELIVFPLISSLALILVSASFFVPTLVLGDGFALSESSELMAYVVIFLFYVVQYTVIFFFNSALVGAAMIRLDGGDPTVGDGFRIAFSRLGSILGYAVIAATVGMLLRTASERSGALGRFVIGLIGMAWNLATFMVVPVLVTRNVSPLQAIKESAAVLKKTWGEQVVGNAGIGFAFFLAYLGLGLVGIPLIIFAGTAGPPAMAGAVIACLVLAFLLLGLINATLSGIYSAALYRFATTGESGGFDGAILRNAFAPKTS